MICLKTRNFSLNRILLLIVGLWPYQRSLLIRFQLIFCFSIVITFIIFQLATFMTSKCTTDLIVKVLAGTLYFLCIMIKYNSFRINMNIIRDYLELLQNVCNDLKDENEIAIIEKYGSKAKRITIIIIYLGMCGGLLFIFLQNWPHIRHILRMNKSQEQLLIPFETEYFIDEEKYFFLITMHKYAAFCIAGVTIVATGTMLLTYLQHTCGMFSIASYRMEQAMTMDVVQKCLKSEKEICKEISYAIDIHRKAMEYTDFLMSSFEGMFFFLIATGVGSLCLNLLWVATSNDSVEHLLYYVAMILSLNVYLFVSNYAAQEITEHNDYLFATVYNVQWYVAPLNIQKMILFLLQRGTKTFHVILGGIFVASMESAASIVSTSISYFTVLYSTRQG